MLTTEQINKIIADAEEQKQKALEEYEKINDKLCDFIAELKNTNKTGFERVAVGEEYYYINTYGCLKPKVEYGDDVDMKFFGSNNYGTEKVMTHKLNKRILADELEKFSTENGMPSGGWINGNLNWYITFDYDENDIIAYWSRGARDINQVYFTTQAIAEQAIEKYHDLIMEVMI